MIDKIKLMFFLFSSKMNFFFESRCNNYCKDYTSFFDGIINNKKYFRISYYDDYHIEKFVDYTEKNPFNDDYKTL